MENKDSKLWHRAKARMEFRIHLALYLFFAAFTWGIWAYTNINSHPWPIYLTFFWGIGIVFHFLDAYDYYNRMTEKQYKKLKGPQ